mgnify:CR=1 FL=1
MLYPIKCVSAVVPLGPGKIWCVPVWTAFLEVKGAGEWSRNLMLTTLKFIGRRVQHGKAKQNNAKWYSTQKYRNTNDLINTLSRYTILHTVITSEMTWLMVNLVNLLLYKQRCKLVILSSLVIVFWSTMMISYAASKFAGFVQWVWTARLSESNI